MTSSQKVANESIKRIAAIYHTDSMCKGKSKEEILDNNDAERSIKIFCVGKHSWHIIDSKNGAKASDMVYSIAETVKVNNHNPFEYFKYLMEELKEYPRNDIPEEQLKELMPWSDTLLDYCKQKLKR